MDQPLLTRPTGGQLRTSAWPQAHTHFQHSSICLHTSQDKRRDGKRNMGKTTTQRGENHHAGRPKKTTPHFIFSRQPSAMPITMPTLAKCILFPICLAVYCALSVGTPAALAVAAVTGNPWHNASSLGRSQRCKNGTQKMLLVIIVGSCP